MRLLIPSLASACLALALCGPVRGESLLGLLGGDCGCGGSECGACGGSCDACQAHGCGWLKGHGCKSGCGGHGCHHAKNRPEGLDRYANCGCNGSYNYPVPPLYTYHWPGMYKHQRMTDYHSPWRFPPLRPYVDEIPVEDPPMQAALPQLVRPVSIQTPLSSYAPLAPEARRVGEPESISSKVLRAALNP